MTGKTGKRRKSPRLRSCGLERPPTTLSTYHHYPPGCIILECRLEANRPVARVVQVPANTAATARNLCLPANTGSSTDQVTRVTSRCDRKDSLTADERTLLPASRVLKSKDSKCSLASAGKASVETMILDGREVIRQPASKIVYCPSATSVSYEAPSTPMEIRVTRADNDRRRRLQRPASERTLRVEVARVEPAKSDKASACQRSARAVVGRGRLIPEEEIHGDTKPERELLPASRENIPAYQLERYETRRSKRNGLQDEYFPPLLRSVLEKEEEASVASKFNRTHRNANRETANDIRE